MNIINESWVINISEEGDYKKFLCRAAFSVKLLFCYAILYLKVMLLQCN